VKKGSNVGEVRIFVQIGLDRIEIVDSHVEARIKPQSELVLTKIEHFCRPNPSSSPKYKKRHTADVQPMHSGNLV
jgi:hypothetical protein